MQLPSPPVRSRRSGKTLPHFCRNHYSHTRGRSSLLLHIVEEVLYVVKKLPQLKFEGPQQWILHPNHSQSSSTDGKSPQSKKMVSTPPRRLIRQNPIQVARGTGIYGSTRCANKITACKFITLERTWQPTRFTTRTCNHTCNNSYT